MNDTHENAPPPTAEEGGGTGDVGFPAAGESGEALCQAFG